MTCIGCKACKCEPVSEAEYEAIDVEEALGLIPGHTGMQLDEGEEL
jgi:hypothetical protein